MRNRRKKVGTLSMGETLGFEEVLTVITVLLLLRIVFIVPLVNLDKAKTVSFQTDAYWSREAAHVLSHPSPERDVKPYRAAFGLQGVQSASVSGTEDTLYVEAAAADSSLWIIRHIPAAQRFIALRVQGYTLSFRQGRIYWSQAEQEWFVGGDTVDYGSRLSSRAMEAAFRNWTLRERGY